MLLTHQGSKLFFFFSEVIVDYFCGRGFFAPLYFLLYPCICVCSCARKKKKSCPSFHFPLPMSWQLLKRRAVNLINQIPEYSLKPAFQAWDHTHSLFFLLFHFSHTLLLWGQHGNMTTHPDNYSNGSDILESRNGVRSPFYSKLKPCAVSQVTRDDG